MAIDLDDVKTVVPKKQTSAKKTPKLELMFQDQNVAAAPLKTQNTTGLPKILQALYAGVLENPLPKKLSQESWDNLREAFRFPKENIEQVKKILSANLTKGQKAAFFYMADFVLDTSSLRFFSLQGYAGTGKTYVVRRLVLFCDLMGIDWLLTAPTNKATKVLTGSIPGIEKSKCKTIYSALKLTMSTDEDQQVLVDTLKDDYSSLEIRSGSLLCIDESSMLNSMVTRKVAECSKDLNLRVLLIGDPDQLRPVGEERSTAWDLSQIETRIDNAQQNIVRHVKLLEVKRFENALLDLSVRLRDCIKNRRLPKKGLSDLFKYVPNEIDVYDSAASFEHSILKLKTPDDFRDTKVIAWRNRAVERYNELIRQNLGFTDEFNIGDLLLLAQPKLQRVNYRRSIIVANIDEEVVVQAIAQKRMQPTSVYFPHLPSIDFWELTTQTTDFQDKPLQLVLNMPIAEDHGLEDALQQMAAAAKRVKQQAYKEKDRSSSKRLHDEASSRWREYWGLREGFTLVRFAYAITAHRAQGSSIDKVYVDVRDILANQDPDEKLQCLYVGCTRVRTQLGVLI